MLDGDGALIQFQIWIRSGAAIFAKSQGLRSYYPVGFTSLYAASLRNVVVGLGDGDGGGRNNPSSQPQSPVVLHLPIQSEVVKGGMMTVTILGDRKFPERYGNGWSFTDPSTDTAYNDYNKKNVFQPSIRSEFRISSSSVTAVTIRTPNELSRYYRTINRIDCYSSPRPCRIPLVIYRGAKILTALSYSRKSPPLPPWSTLCSPTGRRTHPQLRDVPFRSTLPHPFFE